MQKSLEYYCPDNPVPVAFARHALPATSADVGRVGKKRPSSEEAIRGNMLQRQLLARIFRLLVDHDFVRCGLSARNKINCSVAKTLKMIK